MTVHVAINGIGRIGRNIRRPSSKTGKDIEVSRSMTSGLSRPLCGVSLHSKLGPVRTRTFGAETLM
jgi:hypothetical protein